MLSNTTVKTINKKIFSWYKHALKNKTYLCSAGVNGRTEKAVFIVLPTGVPCPLRTICMAEYHEVLEMHVFVNLQMTPEITHLDWQEMGTALRLKN